MLVSTNQSLVWEPVFGATAYDVQLSTNPPNGLVTFTDILSTSISATTLFQGRSFGTYNARVRAKGARPGDWSPWLRLRFTDPQPPRDVFLAPSNLRVEP